MKKWKKLNITTIIAETAATHHPSSCVDVYLLFVVDQYEHRTDIIIIM